MAAKIVESEESEAITIRKRIKHPEITVKKCVAINENVPSRDEKQVDKSEQPDEVIPYEESKNLQIKTNAFIKPHKLHVNIPLIEAISQIPNYAKFLKEILSKKRRLIDFETIKLNEEYSAILQNKLPLELQHPGSLKIPCSGNDLTFNCLCDSGASINLMSFSVYRILGLEKLKDRSISLQLVDRSIKYPRRVVENVLIKVGIFIFPVDFVVLDIEESLNVVLFILGRSFLSTSRAIMDFESDELTLRVEDKQEKFKIYNTMKNPLQEEISKKAKEECKCIATKVQQGSKETEPNI
ncbi:uncharacterized protein LOC111386055 [Olea europaea var. sylvestris]|uniref:uncharacterized protein LOC111386055 n=1 Tax=Olea europaea var. sylvestris TaxID=158386 RepID=UPI000C1D70C8|nr:uncharacterized protein LOC111386055 [Olea europaea var. sylvestris]